MNWETVATFDNAVAAEMAKNLLEGHGIQVMVVDEETVAVIWSLSNAVPEKERGPNPERQRNHLALISSKDLRSWEVRAEVLSSCIDSLSPGVAADHLYIANVPPVTGDNPRWFAVYR